ncbi:hypothetical protein, partial [Roseivirga misakiensis]|uniref:hypothetical protein n=1 Tax=Roseivirga misakiensis TaxID=1563681 RepID=UPI001C9E840B
MLSRNYVRRRIQLVSYFLLSCFAIHANSITNENEPLRALVSTTETFSGGTNGSASGNPFSATFNTFAFTGTTLSGFNAFFRDDSNGYAQITGSRLNQITIKLATSGNFKLEEIVFEVANVNTANDNITVNGYKNNGFVASATTTFLVPGAIGTEKTVDFTGIAAFNDIDEIRIEIADDGLFGGLRIESITTDVAAASDTDPPTFDVAPSASSVTTTGFTAGASIDEGGDIYYVVVADGASAPTPANVIAGQANGGGSPIVSGSGTNLTDPFTLSSAVTGLTASTAYDVYFIARDDESTPNVQATVTKVDVTTLAPSSLQIAATVFLEGAYNGTNLNTAINSSIPAQQPYNGVNSHSQTTSVSIPANAVDWVLVELREASTAATATNATRKGSTAGFLMNDGTIKATDGTSNLTINLTGNTGTAYYVVIYHRNHLPIMSAAAIDGSGGTLTIDFTSNSANTYQTTTALASLSNNKFGMPSGDVNQDGNINSTDLSTWRTNNGAVYSYSGNGN